MNNLIAKTKKQPKTKRKEEIKPPLLFKMGQLVSHPMINGSTNGIVCGCEWGGDNTRHPLISGRREWFYWVYPPHDPNKTEATPVAESTLQQIT